MNIEIRGFILDNIEELKSIMPTPDQARILKIIRSRTILGFRCTAFDLSQESGVSIHNASMKLFKLYKAGWLIRFEAPDITGGIFYQYLTNF